jgi:hypothetical protein
MPIGDNQLQEFARLYEEAFGERPCWKRLVHKRVQKIRICLPGPDAAIREAWTVGSGRGKDGSI